MECYHTELVSSEDTSVDIGYFSTLELAEKHARDHCGDYAISSAVELDDDIYVMVLIETSYMAEGGAFIIREDEFILITKVRVITA